MDTQARSAFSLIAVLFLISLTGCGSGSSSGDPSSTSVTPTATVKGLDPNTTYYFAVSAYNELSGPCSNEVSAVTPLSGAVSLAWGAVQDPTVSAYDVHYGKQPSGGQLGDCNYVDSIQVPAPVQR